MNTQNFAPWRCYAKPVVNGGKTCGHLNVQGVMTTRGLGRRLLLCCERCGCSKRASDFREADAIASAKRVS
jgi:hypothetical protein